MADEDAAMSQKVAGQIAELTKLGAKWKEFESPKAVKERNVYQAQILGEAMLKLSARVPAEWHAHMLEVAKELKGKVSKNKEPQGEEPENEEWVVTRKRLLGDGWRFEKDSDGKEWLCLPRQTEQSQARTPP